MFGLAPYCCERSSESVPDTVEWTDRFFGELIPSSLFWQMRPTVAGEHSTLMPAFDISETDEYFVIRADLPGIEAKDLEVSIRGDILTIRGEKKDQRNEEKENCCFSERRFGSFSRSFSLPSNVKEEGIEAVYKDGVLQLNVPKAETARQKKIEVRIH